MNQINANTIKINRFPDGEVQVGIPNMDRRLPAEIIWHVRNAEELFCLIQIGDILKRQEIIVERLYIPYLMSARNDRVMDFNYSVNLRLVVDVVNQINAKKVIIAEPHSRRMYDLVKNLIAVSVLDELNENEYNICYPDVGAQDRYERKFRNINVLYGTKKRVGQDIINFAIEADNYDPTKPIMVIDDLCDGGGTFLGIRKELEKFNPVKTILAVTHAVQIEGIQKVAEVYDEVIISNTYKDWKDLPYNVKVLKMV